MPQKYDVTERVLIGSASVTLLMIVAVFLGA